MRQIHLEVTEEQFKVLARYPNKSEAIRQAIDLYNECTTTDVVRGLQVGYKNIAFFLKELNSKVDYLAKQVVPKT